MLFVCKHLSFSFIIYIIYFFPFKKFIKICIKNTCFTQGFRAFTHKTSEQMHLGQQTKIPQGT